MKTTVALKKEVTQAALELMQKSLQRRRDKETNPLICEIIDKDIAELQNAINTATEGK